MRTPLAEVASSVWRGRQWRRALASLALILAVAACSAEEPAPTAQEQPEDPRVRFWEEFRGAQAARRAGDRDLATAHLQHALDLNADHADTLYYLAQLRYERGELPAAIAHLGRLTELEPRGLRPWQQLSVMLGQPVAGYAVDLETARSMAGRALELNPGESWVHLLLARWSAYAGDTEAALSALQTGLGHNPQLWQGYLLQLWLGTDAEQVRAHVIEQLCGGQEGTGPTCPSHRALHTVLDARRAATGRATSTGGARSTGLELDDMLRGGDGLGALPADAAGGAGVWRLGSPALALVGRTSQGRRLLPAHRIAGRSSGDRSAAAAIPTPVAWRAVALRDEVGSRVVLLGGAGTILAFEAPGGAARLQATNLAGVPAPVSGAVAAAGDLDADGVDDLFIANIALGSDGEQIGGQLFRGLGAGRFEPTRIRVPGPLQAAAIGDLDGDGDADLLVARVPVPESVTAPAGVERAIAEPTVRLWRNRAGQLAEEPDAVPEVHGHVQDILIHDIDGDGTMEVYLATGPLLPEYAEPDRLWEQRDSRLADASARLGTTAQASTLRAWPLGGGRVALLRGGLVPGDPQRLVRIQLAR